MDKDDKTDPKNAKIWSPAIDRTPFSVVNTAIDLANSYKSGFFTGVESIIVNPPQGGDGKTKGYVTNRNNSDKGDESKIIYIFVEANKQEAKSKLKSFGLNLTDSQLNEFLDEATSLVIAKTMVHEKEHVDDKLKSGEHTAEQKEKESEPFFDKKWDALVEKINKKHAKADVSFVKIMKLANVFFEQSSKS